MLIYKLYIYIYNAYCDIYENINYNDVILINK